LFLVLAILGVVLPLLPTTPFLLLTAYFYSKSNPRLHMMLRHNKYLGKTLREWEEKKAISPKIKVIAIMTIVLVMYFKIIPLNVTPYLKIPVCFILVGVIIFIASRKNR
jgi:uncharacterized membrane protein YbaN (DUF454 family)